MPRISITVKNAIVYFLLLAFTSLFLGYSIYRISSKKVLENATLSLNHNNESVITQFHTFLEDIRSDIWILSKNPFLFQFIDQPLNKNLKENLSQEYLALLSTKKHYSQIRLIGLKNKGKEIIRAEKFSDHIGLVDESRLQEKGDRDYFRETIQLPADSIYFSVINLNQEYGKVILPIVPTMRVAKPVFHNGSIFGILIINVDLTYVFNELKKIAGSQFTLHLINSQGYYLIHPDSTKVFGFEFERPPSVVPAQSISDITKSFSLAQQDIYSIKNYLYPRSNYQLYFSLSASKNIVLSVFNQWKKDIILLTLVLTLFSLFIAWWWTQRQTKEFKAITNTIIHFGKSPEKIKLEIDRDDEIGDLANSFQEMANRINLNLNELKAAKTEAIEATKAKSEFLDNMSHEIRNPLQSILGMTGMLSQNKPRPDQQAFIDTLKFSSDTLLTLVNDILDYRKLIHGQIELKFQKTDIKEYIDNILKSHLFDARNKKLKLKLDLDKELHNKIMLTDPVRLGQILHNLLSNAIRHSSTGAVVQLQVVSYGAEAIRFSVLDEGSGLTAENIENILLQKPVIGDSRQTQNVGLGLPIVINLLKLFGVQLEIQSKEKKGSCFSFLLETPLYLLEQQNELKSSHGLEVHGYLKSVVCIDDDAQNIFLYTELFKKHQIDVVCYDSPEFLSQHTGEAYDLIITDLNFQDSTIADYLENLKSVLKEKGNIILITAADQLESTLGRSVKAFDGILQKPVTTEILFEMISTLVFNKHYEQANLNNLYQNYDFQSDKVLRAFELTYSEWEDMTRKLLQSIQSKDTGSFDKTFHKLVNTIRSFELFSLQNLLIKIRSEMEQQNFVPAYWMQLLTLPLFHYRKIFESEIYKLRNS